MSSCSNNNNITTANSNNNNNSESHSNSSNNNSNMRAPTLPSLPFQRYEFPVLAEDLVSISKARTDPLACNVNNDAVLVWNDIIIHHDVIRPHGNVTSHPASTIEDVFQELQTTVAAYNGVACRLSDYDDNNDVEDTVDGFDKENLKERLDDRHHHRHHRRGNCRSHRLKEEDAVVTRRRMFEQGLDLPYISKLNRDDVNSSINDNKYSAGDFVDSSFSALTPKYKKPCCSVHDKNGNIISTDIVDYSGIACDSYSSVRPGETSELLTNFKKGGGESNGACDGDDYDDDGDDDGDYVELNVSEEPKKEEARLRPKPGRNKGAKIPKENINNNNKDKGKNNRVVFATVENGGQEAGVEKENSHMDSGNFEDVSSEFLTSSYLLDSTSSGGDVFLSSSDNRNSKTADTDRLHRSGGGGGGDNQGSYNIDINMNNKQCDASHTDLFQDTISLSLLDTEYDDDDDDDHVLDDSEVFLEDGKEIDTLELEEATRSSPRALICHDGRPRQRRRVRIQLQQHRDHRHHQQQHHQQHQHHHHQQQQQQQKQQQQQQPHHHHHHSQQQQQHIRTRSRSKNSRKKLHHHHHISRDEEEEEEDGDDSVWRDDASIMVQCANDACKRESNLVEARKGYKNCHHCLKTYYCSRGCRREDWPRHKEQGFCHGSRVSSACKKVIEHCNSNPGIKSVLSRLALRGYLSHGRGCVMLGFPDLESTEEFMEFGFPMLELNPIYVSAKELSDSKMYGNVLEKLLETCRLYKPDIKFVLNVGVGLRFNKEDFLSFSWLHQGNQYCYRNQNHEEMDTFGSQGSDLGYGSLSSNLNASIPSGKCHSCSSSFSATSSPKTSPKNRCKHCFVFDNSCQRSPSSRHKAPILQKFIKLKLSPAQFAAAKQEHEHLQHERENEHEKHWTFEKHFWDEFRTAGPTLILTRIPECNSGAADVGDLNKNECRKRELTFINIQRKLRERNVNLRQQYPVVHAHLIAYVTKGVHFPSQVLFPVDTKTRKTFTCFMMPEAEAELEWMQSHHLLNDLELSRDSLNKSMTMTMNKSLSSSMPSLCTQQPHPSKERSHVTPTAACKEGFYTSVKVDCVKDVVTMKPRSTSLKNLTVTSPLETVVREHYPTIPDTSFSIPILKSVTVDSKNKNASGKNHNTTNDYGVPVKDNIIMESVAGEVIGKKEFRSVENSNSETSKSIRSQIGPGTGVLVSLTDSIDDGGPNNKEIIVHKAPTSGHSSETVDKETLHEKEKEEFQWATSHGVSPSYYPVRKARNVKLYSHNNKQSNTPSHFSPEASPEKSNSSLKPWQHLPVELLEPSSSLSLPLASPPSFSSSPLSASRLLSTSSSAALLSPSFYHYTSTPKTKTKPPEFEEIFDTALSPPSLNPPAPPPPHHHSSPHHIAQGIPSSCPQHHEPTSFSENIEVEVEVKASTSFSDSANNVHLPCRYYCYENGENLHNVIENTTNNSSHYPQMDYSCSYSNVAVSGAHDNYRRTTMTKEKKTKMKKEYYYGFDSCYRNQVVVDEVDQMKRRRKDRKSNNNDKCQGRRTSTSPTSASSMPMPPPLPSSISPFVGTENCSPHPLPVQHDLELEYQWFENDALCSPPLATSTMERSGGDGGGRVNHSTRHGSKSKSKHPKRRKSIHRKSRDCIQSEKPVGNHDRSRRNSCNDSRSTCDVGPSPVINDVDESYYHLHGHNASCNNTHDASYGSKSSTSLTNGRNTHVRNDGEQGERTRRGIEDGRFETDGIEMKERELREVYERGLHPAVDLDARHSASFRRKCNSNYFPKDFNMYTNPNSHHHHHHHLSNNSHPCDDNNNNGSIDSWNVRKNESRNYSSSMFENKNLFQSSTSPHISDGYNKMNSLNALTPKKSLHRNHTNNKNNYYDDDNNNNINNSEDIASSNFAERPHQHPSSHLDLQQQVDHDQVQPHHQHHHHHNHNYHHNSPPRTFKDVTRHNLSTNEQSQTHVVPAAPNSTHLVQSSLLSTTTTETTTTTTTTTTTPSSSSPPKRKIKFDLPPPPPSPVGTDTAATSPQHQQQQHNDSTHPPSATYLSHSTTRSPRISCMKPQHHHHQHHHQRHSGKTKTSIQPPPPQPSPESDTAGIPQHKQQNDSTHPPSSTHLSHSSRSPRNSCLKPQPRHHHHHHYHQRQSSKTRTSVQPPSPPPTSTSTIAPAYKLNTESAESGGNQAKEPKRPLAASRLIPSINISYSSDW